MHQQWRDGFDLRNIVDSPGSLLGRSPLDGTVSLSQQDAWLATGETPEGLGTRQIDEDQRQRYEPRAAKLTEHPDSDQVIAFLAWYVAETIPRPFDTERTFWNCTAMPATNRSKKHHRLGAVTVGNMETAVAFEIDTMTPEYGWQLATFVNVSASVLEQETGQTIESLDQANPDLTIRRLDYGNAGGDCANVTFFRGNIEAFEALPWQDAARAMALRLMRKGRSMQGRWHNYALADEIVARIQRAADRGNSCHHSGERAPWRWLRNPPDQRPTRPSEPTPTYTSPPAPGIRDLPCARP